MKLAETRYGDTNGIPLLIAHGLFGSGRNWSAIAKRLSDRRDVVAVDMRNHGDSGWNAAHDYEALAQDLAETMPSRADVLGHSMGGKAAMMLALRTPARVRRLIVADIAPVAYTHTHLGHIKAMKSMDLAAVETRREADNALAVHEPDAAVRAFLLQSLDLRARRWRLNLDALAHQMSAIVGFPNVSGQFTGPTLFLTGAQSDYVTRTHRDRIRRLFPKARFIKVLGAGHWLHAEKPREVEAAVRVFLDA